MDRSSLVLVFLGALLCASASPAADKPRDEEVLAIQERIFDRDHEIGANVGFVPDQDFHHAFPLALSYTFHFGEILGWEVLRAQYVVNREKQLKKDLEDDFGVTPTEFDKIQYLLHSSVVVKPSYGKDALWNRRVVNHETYLLLGGGLVGYERETSQGGKTTENTLSVSFGAGWKWFLSKSLCLNLEVRDYVNFKDKGVENEIYLSLGLGYRFNLRPRKAPEDEAAGRLKGYLREGKNP